MFYKSTCFLQNKANFKNGKMDTSITITKDYEKKSNRTLGENKPNPSTPLRTGQSQSAFGGQVSPAKEAGG